MRCQACQRPMNSPAYTQQTRGRLIFYGPKCARKAGLIERKERHKPAQAQPAADPNQLALEFNQ